MYTFWGENGAIMTFLKVGLAFGLYPVLYKEQCCIKDETVRCPAIISVTVLVS